MGRLWRKAVPPRRARGTSSRRLVLCPCPFTRQLSAWAHGLVSGAQGLAFPHRAGCVWGVAFQHRGGSRLHQPRPDGPSPRPPPAAACGPPAHVRGPCLTELMLLLGLGKRAVPKRASSGCHGEPSGRRSAVAPSAPGQSSGAWVRGGLGMNPATERAAVLQSAPRIQVLPSRPGFPQGRLPTRIRPVGPGQKV